MQNALVFHLKSKVFNNVGNPLKAQSSIQVQRLPTMLAKLKAHLVMSCAVFVAASGFRYTHLCVCERGGFRDVRCYSEITSNTVVFVLLFFSFKVS